MRVCLVCLHVLTECREKMKFKKVKSPKNAPFKTPVAPMLNDVVVSPLRSLVSRALSSLSISFVLSLSLSLPLSLSSVPFFNYFQFNVTRDGSV